jgi:hypothetical protein
MSGQPAPSAPPGHTFNRIRSVIGRDGQAVFWADTWIDLHSATITTPRLYRYADGAISFVADLPDRPHGYLSDFGKYDFDGENLAFVNVSQIDVERDGTVRTLAIDGQPAPDGALFHINLDRTLVTVNAGRVAFTSADLEYPYTATVYSDFGGQLQRIAGPGDLLFGQTVTGAWVLRGGLSGNQIAFTASFTNGTSGVFIATVPEPAAAAALVVVVTLVLRPRRAP